MASHSSPNIVFIICHDLGQHCGCYGAGTKTRPIISDLRQTHVSSMTEFRNRERYTPLRDLEKPGQVRFL